MVTANLKETDITNILQKWKVIINSNSKKS